jgi:hypothetical protein
MWVFSLLAVCALGATAAGQDAVETDLGNPQVRKHLVERLAQQSRQKKAAAWQIAKSHGRAPKWQANDTIFELMAIEGDRVYVYKTCNVNSAISIGVNLIRDVEPYDVNGAGIVVGLWDGGAVRTTHQEFDGRVLVLDSTAASNHTTHVAGTIGAAGIIANAKGMAPRVLIDSYDWNDDLSEMTGRAMSYAGEPGTIQVSNHSYSTVCGWDNSTSQPAWYGTWGYRESDYFGAYDSETAQWDGLCCNAPYYLPFKAAGNDRDNAAPADGEQFEYYKFPVWRQKAYDSATDPYADGWDNGGFDTIIPVGTAKNIVTVGAVNDAVSGGVRSPSNGTMTSFSSWGPTDDGRIKPDVVTNGVNVYSSTASGNNSYASYTGTSMAAPAAAGAAILLTDYYERLFTSSLRASTIKALIIHGADDLGNAGPDYKFGWGLINAEAAADLIGLHYSFSQAHVITEDVLTTSSGIRTYTFEWDGTRAIRATLCWTDPAGRALTGLDNSSPRLVNDLDLRIVGPDGSTTYYPFVLNRILPDQAATRGDNVLDNVEQVLIETPTQAGTYTVCISHKGTLTNNQQYYSLVISGQRTRERVPADINNDGLVNMSDLAVIGEHWLESFAAADLAPEGGDGIVNFLDFAVFAQGRQ